MHELTIAVGMVDELIRIAGDNRAKKIKTVNLRIGRMSGIVTDSLKFAFDAVKLEHPVLASADIMIDEIPLIYECNDCQSRFQREDNLFPSCPECSSLNLTIISGEEQHIGKVEMEV